MYRRSILSLPLGAIAVLLASLPAARAADADLLRFKAAIDGFFAHLGPATNGALEWLGSKPYAPAREGGTLVAAIRGARLRWHGPGGGTIRLGRFEISEAATPPAPGKTGLALVLPQRAAFGKPGPAAAKLALDAGKAQAVVDDKSGRIDALAMALAGARLDIGKTGFWMTVGPFDFSSKIVGEGQGGWQAPVAFTVRHIAFFVPGDKASGTIDRISVTGDSAGPSRAAFERFRRLLDKLDTGDPRSRAAHLAALSAMLSQTPAAFATASGKAELDGVAVHDGKGAPLFALDKAALHAEIKGFDGKEAAIGLGVRETGLQISGARVDPRRVPHRAVVDLALGNISMAALRQLMSAAAILEGGKEAPAKPGDKPEQAQAIGQLLGAAAKLDPRLSIEQIALDTKDVGIALHGTLEGSPFAREGYRADADLEVRGFDAIPEIFHGIAIAPYLPVLKVLARRKPAADGSPRLDFHLASTAQHRLVVNGADLDAWLGPPQAAAGEKRLLKPADPPLRGADVRAVERALGASPIDGVYRPEVAAAVARFQKAHGLNPDGVVDAATRRALGLKN